MKAVLLESLGLCEHCNVLISLEEMPAEALDAIWHCPSCNAKLTHCSFGYDRGLQDARKVKWVGSDGQWTDQKPSSDFGIGNWFVLVPPPNPLRLLW